MIYGYVRVSTASQKIDRQLKIISSKYPDAVIYSEKYTGSTNDRPEWNKLMKHAKSGDVIVFEDVSRFSRDDADSAFALYEELYRAGIELEFISKPYLNTAEYKKLGVTIKHDSGLDNELADAINNLIVVVMRKQFKDAFEQSHQELLNIRKNIKQGMAASDKVAGHKKGDTYMTNREFIARDIILAGVKAGYPDSVIKNNIREAFERELPNIKVHKISDVTYYKYKRNALGRPVRQYNKKSSSNSAE